MSTALRERRKGRVILTPEANPAFGRFFERLGRPVFLKSVGVIALPCLACVILLAFVPDAFFRTLTFSPPSLATIELYERATPAVSYPHGHTSRRLETPELVSGPLTLPVACSTAKCALLMHGMGQALTVALDGTDLGTTGFFPRSVSNPAGFPGMVALPLELAVGEHQLRIRLLRRPGTAMPDAARTADVVLYRDAVSYARATTVRLAFMPVASSLGLVFIALVVCAALGHSRRQAKFGLVLIAYCCFTALAHFLFSDMLHEKMGFAASSAAILVSRRLGDVAFFVLATWTLRLPAKVNACVQAAVGIFTALTGIYCGALLHRFCAEPTPLGFVSQAVDLIAKTEFLKFYPITICLLACACVLRQPRFVMPFIIFLYLLTVTVFHEANIFGFPYRAYVGKLHGFLVGAVFLRAFLRARSEAFAAGRIKSASDSAKASQAKQVAHDMRSPLAALQVLSANLTGWDDASRELFQTATARLTAIAGLLLAKGDASQPEDARACGGAEAVGSFPVLRATAALIAEKNVELRPHPGIMCDFARQVGTAEMFLAGDTVEFQRVLSNLVNNAAEALQYSGRILVRLHDEADAAVLSVSDDGPGIASHVLTQLGREGATFNKTGGNGLGLAHASAFAARNGGRLELLSEEGMGTEVLLTLPKRPAPAWYVETSKAEKRAEASSDLDLGRPHPQKV